MNQLSLSLPAWITSFLNEQPKIIAEQEAQMRFVLALTERNIREKTGGPFGSAVFEIASGKLVSVGVNVVVQQNCSAAHAEMMALMLAQKELSNFDLGAADFPAHRLVTSGKMCAMCLGNVCWSGVKEVLSSAEPEDVESIAGFDAQLENRGINIVPGLLRSEGQRVLQLYVDLGGLVYNPKRN